MNEPDVRVLIEQVMGTWNQRDIDAFIGFLDESENWSDPAMLYGPAVGKAAVREFCEKILGAFPDFAIRIREPICVSPLGEGCEIPWQITTTHSGRFDPVGFAPTNQTITIEGGA